MSQIAIIDQCPSFSLFSNKEAGLLYSDPDPRFPVHFYNAINDFRSISLDTSWMGFIYKGTAKLKTREGVEASLNEGCYFSAESCFDLQGDYQAIIIKVEIEKGIYPDTQYRAMNLCGGKINTTGRLKYIDGCSDSILIPTIKQGDPCLNHLHFPKQIIQTTHTHPSARLGCVYKGNGRCITPFGILELTEGSIFVIKPGDGEMSKGLDGNSYPNGSHCFYTYDETMDVIAFHPDSDFGATDTNHPMVNKTIVNGISASLLQGIQTK